MALELPGINKALGELLEGLPAPVRAAASHTVNAGGKRLRALLVVLCARLFGCHDKKELKSLACTLEMLHAATLMHDDVIDNAATRRGKPAAHTVYGSTEAILAGDALLSYANAHVATFGSTKLCEIFARATAETTAGEILELHAFGNPELENSEYEDIIRGKTAFLIRAACEMGAVFAGAGEKELGAMGQYGECLGMAFQIVDDALDVADEKVIGKPSGGDLREGKLTLPLRLYRDGEFAGDALSAFNEKFRSRSFTDEDVKQACDVIRARGYDRKARELANTFLDEAAKCLAELPKGDENAILQELLAYVRDREK